MSHLVAYDIYFSMLNIIWGSHKDNPSYGDESRLESALTHKHSCRIYSRPCIDSARTHTHSINRRVRSVFTLGVRQRSHM